MEKLIIFDFDGTLVDSEIIACKVFPRVWSEMGHTISEDFFLCNFVGVANDSEIVKSTMALLPADAMEVADRKFSEELRQNLLATRGITELLQELSYQACVASNSSLPYLQESLLKTGLACFFADRVYSASQVAKPKPAPDLFLHAAQTLNFAPRQCLVIEDSLSGIRAAKNAGMTVVGYMGGLHCNEVVRNRLKCAAADHYCHDSRELQSLIRSWNP